MLVCVWDGVDIGVLTTGTINEGVVVGVTILLVVEVVEGILDGVVVVDGVIVDGVVVVIGVLLTVFVFDTVLEAPVVVDTTEDDEDDELEVVEDYNMLFASTF